MEKGGPFIDVVCRTRYIGRDCRSIDHAGVAFEGLRLFVLARFEDPWLIFFVYNERDDSIFEFDRFLFFFSFCCRCIKINKFLRFVVHS